MKRIAPLLAVFLSLSYVAHAQVELPQPSPLAKIEQRIGLTDITITYSRPSKRGRVIFGDLVPYDKNWRTGANASTVITFSDDVTIGGRSLKKGSYAIYTKPGKDKWDLYFYTDTDSWGLPEKWEYKKVAAFVAAKVSYIPFEVETFTIGFNKLTDEGAQLEFCWDKTLVTVSLQVPTSKKSMASIEKTMSEPSSNDYYQAAVFYFQEGKDLYKAKQWIDRAIEMRNDKPYWMLRQKSLIYAALGDKKGAIEAAKASLTDAEKAKNQEYINLNVNSLKEWGGL